MLACIAAGKPVFCEKPLATTQDACQRIVEAEVAAGRRLVQVGFNRRYDPAHRALKQAIDGGAIGAPLLAHCAHRNASVPEHYTRDMSIADTAIHEIDELRWLFGTEITAVQVLTPGGAAAVARCRTRCSCSSRWPTASSSTSRCR